MTNPVSLYQPFSELRSELLIIRQLRPGDILEATRNLFSPTTWVVAARGHNTPEKVAKYLSTFIESDQRNESLSLVVRHAGEIVCVTRYHSANPSFSKVEIGFTWVADKWQRSFVNTETKRLLVGHAFETFKVKRVEFSVDPKNDKSNRAMLRIGAKLEGTLRKWRYLSENDLGDRNIYSIIDDEWPQVKTHLQNLIERGPNVQASAVSFSK